MTTTLTVAHGTLTVASAGGATVSGSGTNSVTLTGSIAQINATLAAANNVIYRGTSDFNGSDALTITTNDHGNTGIDPGLSGAANSEQDTDTVSITVTAVNDAPVATITPVSYAATEQVAVSLKANGLSISDADAGSSSMTVTLSVTEGTLAITAGTSGAVVTNSGTSSVTITGTVAQINDLLNTNADEHGQLRRRDGHAVGHRDADAVGQRQRQHRHRRQPRLDVDTRPSTSPPSTTPRWRPSPR